MNSPARIGLFLTLALLVVWPAKAQDPAQSGSQTGLPEEEKTMSPAAQRLKELTEAETKDKEKKLKPPYEFYRSQIAPFDVLPFVKPGHWNTISLEMRANYEDYAGYLQSSPVSLLDMPHRVVFRRDARLQKEQDARISMQMMLPQPAREMLLELTRPDAIRPDGIWSASLQRLEPHQMLVPVLSPDPSAYNPWSRLHAVLPGSGDKEPLAIEKQRYYKLVFPQKPEKPVLSAHPLTWTTISHVIWDGLSPEALPSQQRAMIDWLHWGGQLIVVGAGPSVAALQDSFLGPFLPATLSGVNKSMGTEDLVGLSRAYPPPLWQGEWEERNEFRPGKPQRYKEIAPIHPAPRRPLNFVGLAPKPGATPLPLDGSDDLLLGVEWRVGRGRVTMLAFNPVDPALLNDAWPGMDSFVRRVVFRRQEEPYNGTVGNNDKRYYVFLNGRDLSWVRFLGRDLGAGTGLSTTTDPGDIALPNGPVAAWNDAQSELPVMARDALEKASGITIPASSFVLKVILAYVIALVPLNWLFCRFALRRREWAWAFVPLLAFGFAAGVERAAARNLGYDTACDEIDLLEIHGGYPRAHVNRIAALYSTGRDRYTIAFPNDPTALALPLNMGAEKYQRGQDVSESTWQSSPEPALTGFQVQPRSLSMYRAEAIVNLGGTIGFADADAKGPARVVNATNLELHDAVLIEPDVATGDPNTRGRRTPLGTIAAGASVEFRPARASPPREPAKEGEKPVAKVTSIGWLDIEPFLEKLRGYSYGRPEDKGELRLVAWARDPHPGQSIQPKVDRHRGLRLVVAHLRYGPPPDPSADPYFTGGAPKLRASNATALNANGTP